MEWPSNPGKPVKAAAVIGDNRNSIKKRPLIHPQWRSQSTTRHSWTRWQTWRWTRSWMRCASSSCNQPMHRSSPSHCCTSRLAWWRNKLLCWNIVKKPWEMLSIMLWTKGQLELIAQAVWNSRCSMKTEECCWRWWHLSVSNLMKWRCFMKVLKHVLVMWVGK